MRGLSVLLVLCGVALAALLYYRAGHPRTIPVPTANREPATLPIGQLTPLEPKLPVPDLGFTTRRGEPKRLADFAGWPVLVNLWATWCGPCIEEMPSLGRLQAQLGGDLAILAISEDRSGAAAVEPFLARVPVGDLAVYLDATDAAIKAFGVQGLPTTLLIGRDGKVAFKLDGAADWDSPAMVARLRAFIDAKTP